MPLYEQVAEVFLCAMPANTSCPTQLDHFLSGKPRSADGEIVVDARQIWCRYI